MRLWHHYLAWMTLPFVGLVLVSGLLLQFKKHWNWVQPEEMSRTWQGAVYPLDSMLVQIKTGENHQKIGWDDVQRVDVKPSKGLAKFILKNSWEVQFDLGTGQLLSYQPRRSDWVESIHDGSYWAGDISRFAVFVPMAVAMLGLWLTGVYLALHQVRRRAQKVNQRMKDGL